MYLAIRMHNEVSPGLRTPLERAMRASLADGIPDAEEWFVACSSYVRESILDVARPKRAKALPVLIANWVVSSLSDDEVEQRDPMKVAVLAQVYGNELSGYWQRE